SLSTVWRVLDCARTRSATATLWWSSTLPASDASAPFGIRIATGGMCSKESGIESRRTFIPVTSYRFPATSHQPPTTSHQPPATSHQAVSMDPAAANSLLFVPDDVERQPD